MSTELVCRDPYRRQLIRDSDYNGIDYVDVVGTHLCVHFLNGIPPAFLPKKKGEPLTHDQKREALRHILIRGGRRVTGLKAIDFAVDLAAHKYEEDCLGIDLDREGDWSEYTLCFVELDGSPMKGFDPRYACIGFYFKLDCPAEIDCKPDDGCPEPKHDAPAISYLAKDYATFRQLILDRLSLIMPEWRERHVPDIGIALVELLAYVGDYLSAAQDAVGTEQYLETARLRISVRRHARLVDYAMHEGCNARAFVHLAVTGDPEFDPRSLFFVTRTLEKSPVGMHALDVPKLAPGGMIFEPLTNAKTIRLRQAHNLIHIFTWGDEQCCLPEGATSATLLDELGLHGEPNSDLCDERPWPPEDHEHDEKHCHCGCDPPPPPPNPRPLSLKPGDFLLFEELACAGTATNENFDGQSTRPDADRTHRHVVRLTKVTKACDALTGNRLLEVEWGREDALPFPLCVSAIGGPPDCDLVQDLSVARGNLVLADHGASVFDEQLPPVPERPFADVCEGVDDLADVPRIAGRYLPVLRVAPLTFAQPLDDRASATALVRQDPRAALPSIAVEGIPPSPLGKGLLFDANDLHDIGLTAQQLIDETTPARKALRKRLRHDVKKLLDKGKITEELTTKLLANLRELMEDWSPRADLLDSDLDDPHFVAELDDDGFAHLRFGDGDAGRLPDVSSAFVVTYRTGNGRAGLVGPESIGHIAFRHGVDQSVTLVRNPLAAKGAVDPESVAEVKMIAPTAFRKAIERAITADDYALLAQYLRYPARNPRVQSAAASLLWSGSWYEADVSVDAFSSALLPKDLRKSVGRSLHRYRRMGHDLRVSGADLVPLRLVLDLCVKAGYLRAHVTEALRKAMRDFFQPDNLTFGGAIYISRIVEAVMRVDGVAEVHVYRLERLAYGPVPNADFTKGFLFLGPSEIAQLDNDPAAPENGLLELREVRGGR